MLDFIIKKVIGTKNDREVRRLRPIVGRINEIEQSLQSLSEEDLRQKTAQYKARLSEITDLAEVARTLSEIMPEAFALVKTACRRLVGREITVRGLPVVWDMVPFDVQLIGGYALHTGRIAEMATGEGKTLVATLPVYLNALTGRGVHVVTVNDYLAARDSEWMGAVYRLLGLTVGCIIHDQPPHVRRAQYACDITYGTNAEFGFDYLRDNGMAIRAEDQVQRGHYYAIVDEVDSILIDEARTPLIISGPAVVNVDNTYYEQFKPLIDSLVAAQQRLCGRFLDEARRLLDQIQSAKGKNDASLADLQREAGLLLYRVKLGQPKSTALLKLLEDPDHVRLMNSAELELHADQSKKTLYAEKEELLFAIEEKSHDADLTEKGRNFLSPKDPEAFVLPDLTTIFHEIDTGAEADPRKRIEAKAKIQADYETRAQKIHVISQLLKAYCLYEKDVEYVIQNNKVIIVDEHTGRLMTGRRWSDGLHQAVEAKEGVEIERETQTLATITIQNYFRLYHKLAGMTGTAETEASEFFDIYKLGVLVIPTNKPVRRQDQNDSVYKTRREKFDAVVNEIVQLHQQGRPLLVGTISVEASEHLSRLLQRTGIIHNVLNAKYHQKEAEIVARAGQRGSVTIATNMAGRGTDIKLGSGVADVGGLHVIGTERHEARRIDRQLRGRCARQGDPGSSHFFISLEDDLMRLFGSDRIVKVMERVGLEEGQELTHPLLNRSIQTAQKRVEQHNFQIRKRTLEYDDVMNKQREVVYGFRNEIIHSQDVRDRLMDIMEEAVVQKMDAYTSSTADPTAWNFRGLADWVNLNFPLGVRDRDLLRIAQTSSEAPVPGSLFENFSPSQLGVAQHIIQQVRDAYELKASFEDPQAIQAIERYTILTAIDRLWQEHLYFMDSLRNSIGLRAYGQRDPLIEYKAEAYKTFEILMVNIKTEICHNIFRSASSMMAFEQFLHNLPQSTVHQETSAFGQKAPPADPKAAAMVSEAADAVGRARPTRSGPKVGRNDPCPCGSGKKYKQCCGR
ncbi:MAG TPA: preprotein translocase subunit SecA [Candidatus Paceibacterota bacterium]|nr:preprotein translocase subunit SecA [Verrucomicrobiota bacterium]HOX03133.1 preprotein translocase subunit SecA [Verrucomicrobiota bacterium]HRZ45883.1 preprotein translocase subunit SecA [Candidatus Paceibacterota bacterium]HRZ93120.1 preprotein translocase subunit SecA [Candidatus Paceibacterota bacterium]